MKGSAGHTQRGVTGTHGRRVPAACRTHEFHLAARSLPRAALAPKTGNGSAFAAGATRSSPDSSGRVTYSACAPRRHGRLSEAGAAVVIRYNSAASAHYSDCGATPCRITAGGADPLHPRLAGQSFHDARGYIASELESIVAHAASPKLCRCGSPGKEPRFGSWAIGAALYVTKPDGRRFRDGGKIGGILTVCAEGK